MWPYYKRYGLKRALFKFGLICDLALRLPISCGDGLASDTYCDPDFPIRILSAPHFRCGTDGERGSIVAEAAKDVPRPLANVSHTKSALQCSGSLKWRLFIMTWQKMLLLWAKMLLWLDTHCKVCSVIVLSVSSRVRPLNLGWCFLPSKVVPDPPFFRPSVDRFGKNFGGLLI